MIYSSNILYRGWLDYQQAKEWNIIRNITSPFADALKNFMFERGRMNVVLAAHDPISKENSSFINERRTASDKFFEAGLSIMDKEHSKESELLRKEYEKIKALRIKMDEESQKPLLQRTSDIRTLWYTNCTDYINLVSVTLKKIAGISPNSDLIGNYYELIIDTLRFRSIVGNESSIFTSAITGSKTISKDEYAALLLLRGESKQVWSEMKNEAMMIDSDNLIAVLQTVNDRYYNQFRSNQDRLLELALKGQIYDGAGKEIAKLSVPALDSILLLADEAIQEMHIVNQKSIKNGYASFIKGILQLLVSILIIIFIPTFLKTRLIQPLNTIVDLIEDLSLGKTDIINPFIQRNDEIGKLANGVEMLQKSIEEEQALKLELQEAVVKLEELSTKDPLTALYNRRYIVQRINELERRYQRSQSVFSIIISDIDLFKTVNDCYGHDCGDLVLSNIASLISGCCREQDIVARWGGEEFLILLPDTNQDGAQVLAERIRKELEDKTLQCGDISLKITMTFGVSEYSKSLGIEGTIRNADMALLHGKNHGRNQVIVF
ncbi:MAG: diguanylate cyclase [Tepidanaerobacteraceae bacterium]|nr:diguanylate cyclase [Tepidanaerobacteraceae bacterium]